MSASRRFLPAARASLLALAMASPLAFAGHLNILLNADLDGRQGVNTRGNNAIVGDPAGRGEWNGSGIDENRHTLGYNLPVKRIDGLAMAPGHWPCSAYPPRHDRRTRPGRRPYRVAAGRAVGGLHRWSGHAGAVCADQLQLGGC